MKKLIPSVETGQVQHPFYGTHRMVVFLGKAGHLVNRKRVQQLMPAMRLTKYFVFYNGKRPHQALANKRPTRSTKRQREVARSLSTSFCARCSPPPVPLSATNGSCAAETKSRTTTTKTKATPGRCRPAASAVRCSA